ncbi:flavodoxin domain-containing protein [Gordonia sp. ABSL49_1]|uniref:flavodoxin domain-containing protein n=1 Tax=unclassified Gordonia (in: high G+C Gram-positive bacteria) TaxID=2657482 RepID=UPI001F10DF50|nr:flavodoxin domain-containing protein [Gordonia sp. ABSL49_1]MCH5643850.1 flavodoxin domain-containing protein [Gordonia sp. ABSL49_1]
MSATALVAYASADGSTADVAERLGEHLRSAAMHVTVASVGEQPDPADFDIVVAGSPIHDGALLPDFTGFVDDNAAALRERPVWLFSLGMGPTLRGPVGAIFRTKVPPAVAAIRDRLAAHDYHPFAGRFGRPPDRKIRMIMWVMGARPGDHRDWADVERWATTIAQQAPQDLTNR